MHSPEWPYYVMFALIAVFTGFMLYWSGYHDGHKDACNGKRYGDDKNKVHDSGLPDSVTITGNIRHP